MPPPIADDDASFDVCRSLCRHCSAKVFADLRRNFAVGADGCVSERVIKRAVAMRLMSRAYAPQRAQRYGRPSLPRVLPRIGWCVTTDNCAVETDLSQRFFAHHRSGGAISPSYEHALDPVAARAQGEQRD